MFEKRTDDYDATFNMNLGIPQNIDLLSVGIVVAATVLLGFSVYLNNPKSITNKTFFGFALVTAVWGAVNYSSYQFNSPQLVLWLFRLIMYFALFQAFFLYVFFKVFPDVTFVFSKKFKYILVPLVAATAVITLSRFLFPGIVGEVRVGEVAVVSKGPGLIVFGILAVGLVFMGIYELVNKIRRADARQKRPYQIIALGTLTTFFLVILFNFIIATLFSNPRFVPLGSLYFLPFIAFTSYAILKHKLFNLKVAGTGVLVFLLSVVTFGEVLLSREPSLILYRSIVFLLVLLFGILLIRGVLREVRQREMVENVNKELKELDDAKSEFISIASHQLRTPLTAIIGYLSMIKEGDFGTYNDKLQAPIDRVSLSAKRLMNLVETLLDISRTEANRFEISPEMMDIVPIAQRLSEDFQIQARDKNIKLTLDVRSPIPKIYADPLKVEDVLTNVIDNALKYTEKGEVTVRITSAKDAIQCCVQDTGVGLDPAEIPKIFQRFVRGAGASKMNTEGLGMGLYIGERIVAAHGGRLWAQSAGKDQGSTFCFTLPINRKQPIPTSQTPIKVVEHIEENNPA